MQVTSMYTLCKMVTCFKEKKHAWNLVTPPMGRETISLTNPAF